MNEVRGLQDYSWRQEDLKNTQYAGKYVTHDHVNRRNVLEQLSESHVDLETGEHTLYFNGERMNVRLDVNSNWASFMYDETFDEELGEENFEDVITYFTTEERFRHYFDVHPE